MTTFVSDLRYGLRLLLRSPVFTGVATLSLALGIGANTTVFSLVNAVLLSPLPVHEPSRLVSLFTTDKANRGGFFDFMNTSRPNFLDYREENEVFDGLVAFMGVGLSVTGGQGEPEHIFGGMVSGDYFQALGVKPALGRAFLPEEDRTPGAHLVAILSHGLWQRRFGGDPALAGGTVTLNGQPFTIVGVAPAGFRGTFAIGGPDVWVPVMTHPQLLRGFQAEVFDDRRGLLWNVVGRLKPGVTLDQAEANVVTIATQLEQEYPAPNGGRSARLLPLSQATIDPALRGNVVTASVVLTIVVALVLLIACANIANLLLARAAAREREVAVRVSLGAGRGHLLRQFLTESVLLAGLGGAAGLLVAFWAQHALWTLRPAFLQANAIDLSPDWRVLAFTLGVSVATGVSFGLAPAAHASRPGLVNGLKERTGQGGASLRGLSLRNALVVGQVALSVVALVASGLFLRSLSHAQRIDPGFETARLAVLSVNLESQGYNEARGLEFLRVARERAAEVPGVEAVTVGTNVPLGPGGFARTVFPEGVDATDRRNGRFAQINVVVPGYFAAMRIPLVRGRDFTEADASGSPAVVVINETMARQFWPDREAVGQRFRFFGLPNLVEVVGVARDIKYNFLGENPQPFVYQPLRQAWGGGVTLHVRSAGDPALVLGPVRQEIQHLDRHLPITNVFAMRDVLAQSLWAPRMTALLLGVFAALSLVLAIVGLYGLLAYEVTQRTREVGIRLALGAERREVVGLVIRHAMTLTATGIALGIGLAFVLSRYAASLLYDVSPTDAVTYVAIPLLLAAAALSASYLPARQAARVDPVIALRFD
jgi:predicted permease